MEVMERRTSDEMSWKMGRIMLRYRPIAPKPLASGAAPCVDVETTQAVGRAKKRESARRKGGCREGKRGMKPRKMKAVATRAASGSGGPPQVVTLPLMPVTPAQEEQAHSVGSPTCSIIGTSFFGPKLPLGEAEVSPRPAKAISVLVTVESVTEVWSVGLCGSTGQDDELRPWLEACDCPAFISKAVDRVTWTNAAYRRMVVGGDVSAEFPSSSSSSYSSRAWSDIVSLPDASVEEELKVVLVTRGLVPGDTCRAFTCMMSVRHACERRGKVSLAVPCDVWRLDDGSLAWRLDLKAALSLSTGN